MPDSSGRFTSRSAWVAKWTMRARATSGPIAVLRLASGPSARTTLSAGRRVAMESASRRVHCSGSSVRSPVSSIERSRAADAPTLLRVAGLPSAGSARMASSGPAVLAGRIASAGSTEADGELTTVWRTISGSVRPGAGRAAKGIS